MIPLAADENFNADIVRGLLRVSRSVPVGQAIDHVLMIAECIVRGEQAGWVE